LRKIKGYHELISENGRQVKGKWEAEYQKCWADDTAYQDDAQLLWGRSSSLSGMMYRQEVREAELAQAGSQMQQRVAAGNSKTPAAASL
jgi:hypothetical protein